MCAPRRRRAAKFRGSMSAGRKSVGNQLNGFRSEILWAPSRTDAKSSSSVSTGGKENLCLIVFAVAGCEKRVYFSRQSAHHCFVRRRTGGLGWAQSHGVSLSFHASRVFLVVSSSAAAAPQAKTTFGLLGGAVLTTGAELELSGRPSSTHFFSENHTEKTPVKIPISGTWI